MYFTSFLWICCSNVKVVNVMEESAVCKVCWFTVCGQTEQLLSMPCESAYMATFSQHVLHSCSVIQGCTRKAMSTLFAPGGRQGLFVHDLQHTCTLVLGTV